MTSTWLNDWPQKVLEIPITNTVLTVEEKKTKQKKTQEKIEEKRQKRLQFVYSSLN